jgi:hypothetical protein
VNRFDEEDERKEFARICAAFAEEGITKPSDAQFREMRIRLRSADAYVVYEARIEDSDAKFSASAAKALRRMNEALEELRTNAAKYFEGDLEALRNRAHRNYHNRLILLKADAGRRIKKARRLLDEEIAEAGRYHDELIQSTKYKAGN